MKDKIRPIVELILISIVFWSVAMCFFALTRYYDLENEAGIVLTNDLMMTGFGELLRIGLLLGIMIGFFYAIFDYIFDNYLFKRLNMGFLLLIKTITYLLLLIFCVTVIMELVESISGLDLPNEQGWWRDMKIFWVFVAYCGLFSLFFSFLKIARRRFGRGVLFNLLMGRYAKPKEEDRIFMFLDLRSSTTIAEKLGHIAYSSFIRDCFLDLNNILDEYKAEVYQYVGDEAVLSWKYSTGLKRENCVRLFFDFENRLRKRSEYYTKRYGITPEFKAGLHGGKLVVVEVGSVKKELAYHGDVINTTARIQDQCNQYGEDLLISEHLLEDLNLSNGYNLKEIGGLVLRGKKEQLNLHAVNATKKIPE